MARAEYVACSPPMHTWAPGTAALIRRAISYASPRLWYVAVNPTSAGLAAATSAATSAAASAAPICLA
jgi:hypothetical protein